MELNYEVLKVVENFFIKYFINGKIQFVRLDPIQKRSPGSAFEFDPIFEANWLLQLIDVIQNEIP